MQSAAVAPNPQGGVAMHQHRWRATRADQPDSRSKRTAGANRHLELRHALIVACLAVTLGGGVALAWRAFTHPSVAPSVVSAAAMAEADSTRTGTILEVGNGRCRSFDNDTGRVSAADPSCSEALSKSEANRRGTTGRINAISKSFFPNR
jgi:hypothetical protein